MPKAKFNSQLFTALLLKQEKNICINVDDCCAVLPFNKPLDQIVFISAKTHDTRHTPNKLQYFHNTVQSKTQDSNLKPGLKVRKLNFSSYIHCIDNLMAQIMNVVQFPNNQTSSSPGK